MIAKEKCSQLGIITNTYGDGNEFVLKLWKPFPNLEIEKEPVFIDINKRLVPFFIERIRFSGTKAYILFDDIRNESRSQLILNSDVYLPENKFDDVSDEDPDDEYTGYTLIDELSGVEGEIIELIDISSNPLFRIRSKNKDYLIPITEEFIISIDHQNKIVKTKLPEGLLDVQ